MPKDYTPTKLKLWTLPPYYCGETWPDYYCSGFGRSRDSDALERSNFIVALRELGGESETVIVVRESHWACGWVEWIAIHATDYAALRKGDELQESYEAYPSLDEDHWSEIEREDADSLWKCYSVKERVDFIRKHDDEFEFHDFADMIRCVRGEYYAGYASSLLC